ncbi:MAG: hypothetical protein QXJ46_04485 [Candidatus Bathyarchaeia archaeon]
MRWLKCAGTLALSVLLALSLGLTEFTWASVLNIMYVQASPIRAEEPKVRLEAGTAGISIISMNGTSASVSVTPPPTPLYYPSDYNIIAGTRISGSLPISVQAVDNDYFTVGSTVSATSTIQHYPLGYNLLGSTTHVSGSLNNLQSNDENYMTFRSYSVTIDDLEDFVDQQSNVDGADDIGAHSNFTALQSGPDNIFDTLTETATSWSYNTIVFDRAASTVLSTPASSISWSHTTGTGDNKILLVDIGIFNSVGTPATVTSITYGDIPLTLLATDVYNNNLHVRSYLYYLVNPPSGTKNISVTFSASTLAIGGSVTYFNVNQTNPFQTSGTSKGSGTSPSISLTAEGNYDKIFYASLMTYRARRYTVTEGSEQTNRWQQTSYTHKGRGSEKKVTTGQQTMTWTLSRSANFVCIGAILVPASTPSNYELDLEVQWINLDYGRENKYLCIYVGEQTGSESLRVEAWTGSSWVSLGNLNFPNQWNNFSVSPYLTSSTFTIRFLGGTEVGDTIQDRWEIDCVLLHTWDTLYVAEVEFTGVSDPPPWSQLTWTVDGCLTEAGVSVTLQLFDYQANQYPTDGDGYISYVSSDTPNTDETRSQTIMANPERFRDNLGNWKIKVRCEKRTSIQFDLKLDWIMLEASVPSQYKASVEFLFTDMPTDTAAQLNITIVGHCNVTGVEVTIQLWNYDLDSYVESEEGYLQYISSGVNETRVLTITLSPESYTRNGEAKIKVTAVKDSVSPFQQEINKIELCFCAFKYDYVLQVSNQASNDWKIRLRAYGQTDITRLSNCTIYFHTLNGASNQIVIINGEYSQQQGDWYDLTGLSTVYIAMAVSTLNSGTSRIYTYLEVNVPNTTVYNLLTIEFEIS